MSVNVPYKLAFKWVGTFSKTERKIRLFRILWSTGLNALKKPWHSSVLSLTLVPILAKFKKTLNGWEIVMAGIRLRHDKSYGSWQC
jgi:hypothetical protein